MIIEIQNGCFGYTKDAPILKNICLKAEPGQILTVLGPNGIGKTTMLKCMMGMLHWNSGQTLVDGQTVSSLISSRQVAYVPQAHAFSFGYTIEEIVTMGRAKYIPLMASPSKRDMQIVREAMQTVGIYDLKDRKCSQLSGGQLQLAFIARALAAEPEAIILDEPESHLDFKNQFAKPSGGAGAPAKADLYSQYPFPGTRAAYFPEVHHAWLRRLCFWPHPGGHYPGEYCKVF